MRFFADIQQDILTYKDYLDKHNMVIDKTNKMFMDLILNILTYLATTDPDKLDEVYEYNVMTMRDDFLHIIHSTTVDERAEAIFLVFFIRLAKEELLKYNTIENDSLKKLHDAMTSKDYKYPEYVDHQKIFALDRMCENIQRMLRLK
ncbi:MAG: hypothetical protein WC144_03725 [Sulfurimonas sp.]|jgi:hypothetical protein|nr:hypothetical protein [Sulfurimonadaceae bacterium]